MAWDWIGFLFVATWGAVAVKLFARAYRVPPQLERLIWLAWAGRVLGSFLRYQVLYSAYGGSGDAVRYYEVGLEYSEALWRLDFSIFDREYWWAQRLWGTQSVMYISGFVLMLLGPTMPGEFLFFSFLSLLGIGFLIQAVRQESEEGAWSYAPWVALLPSLCFWPSSIGKEALMLLGLGLVTYGYSLRGTRSGLLPLGLGALLVLAIRPYAAFFLAAAIGLAELLQRRTSGGQLRSLLFLGLGAVMLGQVADAYGLDPFEISEVTEFVGAVSNMTSQGGSQIEAGSGLATVPLGLVNVLFRPFLWEASGALGLLCALELTVMWGVLWSRRRTVFQTLRSWNDRRTLRVGLSVTALLSITYGITFFNLGILARQRSLIWPFLLMVIASHRHSGVRPVVRPAVPCEHGRSPGAEAIASAGHETR